MTIAAVLLVPHAEDPLKILAGGPYGSRPPHLYHIEGQGWSQFKGDGVRWKTDSAALVLAWEGKLSSKGHLSGEIEMLPPLGFMPAFPA